MGVADGSSVVGNNVGNLVLTHGLLHDLAELEGGFLVVNSVGHEASLDVVENTEVLASLDDSDDIHEAERETVVSADSVVNSDVSISIFADLDCLLVGESVLKSLSEENGERDRLAELVGASAGAGSVNSTELGKAPVGGCEHALHVLLRSSCLYTSDNTKLDVRDSLIRQGSLHLHGTKRGQLTILSKIDIK